MDVRRNHQPSNSPIAVIGVGCVFPGSPDVDTFWANVCAGYSGISTVDASRWDPAVFFDENPDAPDRTYCQVGGFIHNWQFDGRGFRIPPATAKVMDRAHQYALTAARQAFADAGLDRRAFDRDRAAVILGVGGGRLENEEGLIQRVQLPLLERALHEAFDRHGIATERRSPILAAFREEYLRGLVEVTEDTFAGLCPNVVAGRVANFLDVHGPSYVVDAACAASLASVDRAVDGLRAGDFDLAVCGGVHAHMGPSFFVAFSKFRGLSANRVSPFDEAADGFLLGEGAGVFVLKRLDDALRDDDRVLAVIRGIGSSSDGRKKGIGAPNPEAQALAIRRAFDEATYSPGTVQFLEAHGAGTSVGDPAELRAVHEVFGPCLAPGQRVAVSAVKSQVGHLMGAAGAAGLLKTVLGLHHKVMPPTINHTRPNPAIPWDTLPFDIVTAPRAWAPNQDGLPRRAGVSSFGFGGNNFHLTLEEFDPRWHHLPATPPVPTTPREPVAIVGVGACLPGSPDVEAFWDSVVHQVSAITDVPPGRWDGQPDLYVDADPNAPDKSHGRMGGFTSTPPVDIRRLRISPATRAHIDPGQLQLFASALGAVDSTRLLASPQERQRTAVIFGDSGGNREFVWSTVTRTSVRRAETTLQRIAERSGLSDAAARAIGDDLARTLNHGRPAITEDTIVGIATSIGAARIAKALDLMGTHMTVDAACGSSLAAITIGVRGLQSHKWDAVVTGGVGGGVTPHLAIIASKARALSATGSRPFDAGADGFVAAEGAAAFVLKRLSDAMAAGDRIYGVIRGVGASTDGRGHSMYAPDSSRQALAMRRAFADAGLVPDSVQYVECHATSTPVGDAAEIASLTDVFGERAGGRLGIGSVKAQIGHTMSAAGSAGLLKTVLGLDRHVLPPMPAVASPIAGLAADGPFELVTTPSPWPAPVNGEPRRAGVNAFGFGGTNWHVIVEEYVPAYHQSLVAVQNAPAAPQTGPTLVAAARHERVTADHLFVASGASASDLLASIGGLDADTRRRHGAGPWRLSFVARTKADFQAKVDLVTKHYRPGRRSPVLDAQGIHATDGVIDAGGAVVGLFPGQGPQYADMLRDLAEEYDVVRETIAEANEVLQETLGRTYEQLLFTAGRTPEERATLEQELATRSDIVQPTLVAAEVALFRLVTAQGIRFDALAGHSLGEYAALVCAGALDFKEALRAAHARGQAFRDLAESSGDAGRMAMVTAGVEVVDRALEGVPGYVTIANRNCRVQTVISGEEPAVREAVSRLEQQGVECRILPIAGAFHSRIAGGARDRMAQAVAALHVRPPSIRVLSTVDLTCYEPAVDCAARVRSNLVEQLVAPVDFIGLVERLHADGARAFVEIGPKHALSGFVDDILGDDRPHRTLFANHPRIGEIPQFDRFVAQFALIEPPRSAPAAAAPTATPAAPARDRSGRGTQERIWITGVSVGLPGKGGHVFSDDGLDRLLAGACLIEPVSEVLQDRMLAKRITRLVKSENGEPYLAEVTSRDGAVKLAGQRGAFSLRDEFGLDHDWLSGADIAYQLAVAAGLECLRDARIPLQRAYRRTSRGGSLREGLMLPASLQDDTGVVFASAFGGLNLLCNELERYYRSAYGSVSAGALREQYLKRLEAARNEDERLQADEWFMEERRTRHLDTGVGAYRFKRDFLSDLVCTGNSRFAQLVRAHGPNFALNAACSSTSAALATAEDMIRCGRARRVVVLAADDASSETLFEWVGAGFLAAGAAATDRDVRDAALPFDRRRHGMVVGMGAVGFVVEAEAAARERGVTPVAELLGVRLANSASHMTRPDAGHVIAELTGFLEDMRTRHGLDLRELAANVVYVSHETFTLPSGGIGAVEGLMLKHAFGDRWRDVLVVNTKCATGHAQAASLEDAIMMKALQAGRVPPVLHSTDIDPDLAGINLSVGGTTDREYMLRFSAGFGSQLSLSLTRVGPRHVDRVTSQAHYGAWLSSVTGVPDARVTVIKRVLQVEEAAGAAQAAPVDARPSTTAAPLQGTRPEPVVSTPPPSRAPAPAPSIAAAATTVAPVPALASSRSGADVTDTVIAIIEEKTGYERQFLDLDLDLEADLGIDTIKQAQVMARIRETFQLPRDNDIRVKDFPTLRHVVRFVQSRLGVDDGAAPPTPSAGPTPSTSPSTTDATRTAPLPAEAPRPVATAGPSNERILDVVLDIIEKQTGYEREALDLDLDLEADLGIDTIKQAQVMARIRETFELPKDQSIRMKDFPTVRHVVQYVHGRVGTESPAPAAAVAAAPAPAATPPSSAAGQPDDRVLEAVLGIIEKHTGYEREALELDLDLEADLGIDTIKQAQVMASLREAFNLPREQGLRVKDFPTVRHVVGFITSRTAAGPPSAAAPPDVPQPDTGRAADEGQIPAIAPAASATADAPVPSGPCRMGVDSARCDIEQESPNARLGQGWTVLVTDDGLGVADALAAALEAAGAKVETLRSVEDLAAARARLGRVRALVLLHPLATDPSVAALDAAAWREVLDRKVGASFRVIQALRHELEVAVAATALAGPFGWRGQLLDPAGAGVAGLMKSLAHEAEATLVKTIDVERPATRSEAARLAVTIHAEIERGGRRTEVGYREGTRLVPRVTAAPLDLSGAPRATLSSDSVVVAFGGSRGVTAAVVKELARRYRPRMVLVGTRPLPGNIAELAALDAAGLKALKQNIARGWKARVTGVKPIEIERKYAETLRAIESHRTLQACEAAGATVSYQTCDVRAAAGVRDLVKGVVRQHGRLDGVIFGAGTIEDKLIEDKTAESFDRVFGVKAEGIFNVYKALDGVTLSFVAAFSSVAGRFGNRGQADYAAGNEVLARFIGVMQAARPDTRCVAIDWTGWDEVGLAARSGVIELMKEQGFEALTPTEGARFFREELAYGAGPDEIVIASAGLPIDRDRQLAPARTEVPAHLAGPSNPGVFLQRVVAHANGAWLSARTAVEPDTDPWLRDHVIDGALLVPAVFGIEMMAEAAGLLFPEFHLHGIRDLRLHRAVKVFKNRPVTLTISAVGTTGATDDQRIVRVRVSSDFIGPDGRVLVADREHYTCDVLLGTTPPTAAPIDPRRLVHVSSETPVPPLYGEGGALPHGPTFRVIDRVEGLDGVGVVGLVAALDEHRALPSMNGHRLLTLPFAREAAFQSAGLWGILRHGNFGLPHGCRALHHFGTPPAGTRLTVRAVPTAVDSVRMDYDIDMVGDDGLLYDRMEGFYTVNPLAAVAQTADGAESEPR